MVGQESVGLSGIFRGGAALADAHILPVDPFLFRLRQIAVVFQAGQIDIQPPEIARVAIGDDLLELGIRQLPAAAAATAASLGSLGFIITAQRFVKFRLPLAVGFRRPLLGQLMVPVGKEGIVVEVPLPGVEVVEPVALPAGSARYPTTP